MSCSTPEGQHVLRTLTLAPASRRLRLSVTRVLGGPGETRRLGRITKATDQLKCASINSSTVHTYPKKFQHWTAFCEEFRFPVWIDELSQESQARIVGLFARMCSLEGHNAHGKGNKYQTFDGKMAAVAYAHKSERNARLNYKSPEIELIAQGYLRTNSHVDRKQPVTSPMLSEMHRLLQQERSKENGDQPDPQWGSVVSAFFCLDRGSELWGPAAKVRDRYGSPVGPGTGEAYSVEILFRSHKGDRVRQGNTIRHYKSGQGVIYFVTTADTCFNIRKRWKADGRCLDPYLTSISMTTMIKKSDVAKLIKKAARTQGADTNNFSTHSMLISGTCALLAMGKSETVIRLMGRWFAWCFSVYT
ncbi:hypothetical protein PHMEG_00010393 [Phytophthora megakarya]|uniref:Uncharacterized protein n=1 Tax=Phytophthora megakarya TaxID=4795 RepID=A0A225WFU4_9STRA|nr:hypothetical protein PHMEG_00010393 [Phytophthora megakarya]